MHIGGKQKMNDLISRQAAIDFIDAGHLCNPNEPRWSDNEIVNFLKSRPSAQPETCEGCKHLGKWENEVEYGYPSPCTRCKRRVEDNYER